MASRGLTTALAMMLVLLFAAAGCGQCQQPKLAPSGHHGSYYRGLKECNPLCFVKCAFTGGNLYCYGQCLLQCLFPPSGKPDPSNPEAICMAQCAVPACAKLSTGADPFSKEVELCVESCADGCAEKKADNKQQHSINHSP